jgi:hypothetical protein
MLAQQRGDDLRIRRALPAPDPFAVTPNKVLNL